MSWSIDLNRISRSLSQFLDLMDFFDKHAVALVSVTQNINTGDAMGRLMLQIIMSFAEFERELIRDRVKESMHAARRQGKFIGGRPPLGYNIRSEGGGLEIDELEALIVLKIFKLYLKLRSIKATVCELRKRGVNNKKWVCRNGRICGGSAFITSSLYNLLTNPVYIGKVTLKGEVYDGEHEGIIKPALFEEVQRTLNENSVHKGNKKRNRHHAMLKGLLTCKACGSSFVHTYTRKKNRMYFYYVCGNKKLNGADACPSCSIPAGEIETLVADQLMSIGSDPALQQQVWRQLSETVEQKRAESTQRTSTARRQLKRIDRELTQLREGEAAPGRMLQLESKRRDVIALLEQASCDQMPRIPSKDEIVRILQDMQGLWPNFSAAEKCAFVKALVRQVEFDAVEGSLSIHFNDESFMPTHPGGKA